MVAVSLFNFKESFCDETLHMLSIVTAKAELKECLASWLLSAGQLGANKPTDILTVDQECY